MNDPLAPKDVTIVQRLVQVKAEDLPPPTPEDLARLAETDTWSDEEITRRALSDPDNPPMTDRQIEQMKRGEPITEDPVGLLLLHLEYGDHSDAELAEVIERVAELLHRRMTGRSVHRKAG